MTTDRMLATHPAFHRNGGAPAGLAQAIDACRACATTCLACADACLAEASPSEMAPCIRLDLDCAAICDATAAILLRGADSALSQRTIETCLAFCRACAAECERHAGAHDHCRLCAETCRTCADACESLLQSQAFVRRDAA